MTAAPSMIRHGARRVKSWFGSRVVVLLYHRVADPSVGSVSDPHRICVSPKAFDEQMSVVRSFGPVLRLRELTDAIEARRLPKRGVVVTFDDGYADNLSAALPILQKHDVSATIFTTTGEIGRAREFWWDELGELLLEAGELPPVLRLRVDVRDFAWQFNNCERWTEQDASAHAGWDFESAQTPCGRHLAYRMIYPLLWDLHDEARRAILDDLFAQAGRTPVIRASRRAMSDAEMVEVEAGGLIELGAHTVTHPNLAAQSVDVQRTEIHESRKRLEEVLGHPIESFAYPFGLHTEQTVKLVREAGYLRACACMGHAVRQTSETFRLTRADLGAVTGDAFEQKLKEAFSA